MYIYTSMVLESNPLSSSWIEMVAVFPPSEKEASGLPENAVRGIVSNSSSNRSSLVISTLVHCRAGGGPMELPAGNMRVLTIGVKSSLAVELEKQNIPSHLNHVFTNANLVEWTGITVLFKCSLTCGCSSDTTCNSH